MTIAAEAPTGEYGFAGDVGGMLQGIAAEALGSVGRCDSAAITLVEASNVTREACTDDVARHLHRAQSAAGEGPAVDALRLLQIFNVAFIADIDEWPAFREAARSIGILSSLSVPLSQRGRALGTLNLYSRVANGFEECEGLAMNLASGAAAALFRPPQATA